MHVTCMQHAACRMHVASMGPAFTAGLGPSPDPMGPTITAGPLPEPPWAKLYKLLLVWDIFFIWFDFGVFVASSVVWFGRVPIYI